jgi:dihydroorotate dehydrogenase electron transfer subunit
LIGEGAGIGPTLFLAEQMRGKMASPDAPTADAASIAMAPTVLPATHWTPLVLLGSNTPFPFRPRPSVIVVPGIPIGVIACMPLLEEWGIASRLANTADLPGCFEGLVTDLADTWLSSLSPTDRAEVEILSCGPPPMLEATAALARRHEVPCQTSCSDVRPG